MTRTAVMILDEIRRNIASQVAARSAARARASRTKVSREQQELVSRGLANSTLYSGAALRALAEEACAKCDDFVRIAFQLCPAGEAGLLDATKEWVLAQCAQVGAEAKEAIIEEGHALAKRLALPAVRQQARSAAERVERECDRTEQFEDRMAQRRLLEPRHGASSRAGLPRHRPGEPGCAPDDRGRRPAGLIDATPVVFISYSHDSIEHKQWVASLAEKLTEKGVEVILDQWYLRPGQDLPKFMEQGFRSAGRVLVVCTDEYIRKVDEGRGGAGYEGMLITGELVADLGTTKFIPLVRGGAGTKLAPTCLGTRCFIDFRDDSRFPERLEELVRELHDQPPVERPVVGENPYADPTTDDDIDPVALAVLKALYNAKMRYSKSLTLRRLVDWIPGSSYTDVKAAVDGLTAKGTLLRRRPAGDAAEPGAETLSIQDPGELRGLLERASTGHDQDLWVTDRVIEIRERGLSEGMEKILPAVCHGKLLECDSFQYFALDLRSRDPRHHVRNMAKVRDDSAAYGEAMLGRKAVVFPKQSDRRGWAVCGPYFRLPRVGTYMAVYRVRCAGDDRNVSQTLRFDVHWAKKTQFELIGKPTGGPYQVALLKFSYDGAPDLEIRIHPVFPGEAAVLVDTIAVLWLGGV